MDGSVGEAGQGWGCTTHATQEAGRAAPGQARQTSVTMLVMLVIQYGLGIILNLYVEVPASDAHAGDPSEIATAPAADGRRGARHRPDRHRGPAQARAAGVRDRLLAVLATAGLTTIGGAFGAGEIFVRSGQDTASMAMAILTGMALLCYIGTLTLAASAGREDGGPGGPRPRRGALPQRRLQRLPQRQPLCPPPGPQIGRTTRPSGPTRPARPRAPGSSRE